MGLCVYPCNVIVCCFQSSAQLSRQCSPSPTLPPISASALSSSHPPATHRGTSAPGQRATEPGKAALDCAAAAQQQRREPAQQPHASVATTRKPAVWVRRSRRSPSRPPASRCCLAPPCLHAAGLRLCAGAPCSRARCTGQGTRTARESGAPCKIRCAWWCWPLCVHTRLCHDAHPYPSLVLQRNVDARRPGIAPLRTTSGQLRRQTAARAAWRRPRPLATLALAL